MKPVVLAAELEYGKGKDLFTSAEDLDIRAVNEEESALAEEIKRTSARAVILGVIRYRSQLYPALAGGLIARFGVGCDGIDRRLCNEHKIMVTNTPGVLTQSVAEHAVWLMGNLARKIVRLDRKVRGGSFSPEVGEELAGRNLLIVGFGQIGRRVAAIAGGGLDMQIRAVDCLPLEELARSEGLTGEQFSAKYYIQACSTDVDEFLSWADVVSVHLAASDQTHHFFNQLRFDRFREGGFFVNTARGSVVDEAALYRALTSGKLAGAALDVFENEPYKPVKGDCDLRQLDNVIVTPHVASNTRASNHRMASMCIENCRNFLAGELDKLTRAW